jgi:hypothetical protein
MICALLRVKGLLQIACLLQFRSSCCPGPQPGQRPGRRGAKVPPCIKPGAALDAANGQAKDLLLQFEQDFPAQSNGRRYQIGEADANITYCDGTKEQKYCNQVC